MTRRRVGRNLASTTAEVGIGSMIVFIATVLGASIAAGVILEASGKLQERGSATGQAATRLIASNIFVDGIMGARNGTGDTEIQWIEVFVSVAPGAQALDLSLMKITWRTDDGEGWLNYTNEAWGEDNEFTASEVRDPDSSFTTAEPTLNEGDLVRIRIASRDADVGMNLDARTEATLLFDVDGGLLIEFAFTTPNAYGTDLNIDLS